MDKYEGWQSHEGSCWDILDNENIWSVSIYTFIKNNTFNTSNASQTDASVSQLLSYLLCAKLSVSLYWCQIVHFLKWCQIVRLPLLCQIMGFYYHSEKISGAKLS